MRGKELRRLFARNLRAARLREGLTCKQAAARADTTGASWSRWESGLALPRWEQLAGIVAALGVRVAQLLSP